MIGHAPQELIGGGEELVAMEAGIEPDGRSPFRRANIRVGEMRIVLTAMAVGIGQLVLMEVDHRRDGQAWLPELSEKGG